MIESILLTTVRVFTFRQGMGLSNASGFFFARDERLFLVTSGHVLFDAASQHLPDRIEIELHTDPADIGASTGFSIPLYRGNERIWRSGLDRAGAVDVAVIEIERPALPAHALYHALGPQHLPTPECAIEIGSSLLVVGYPLGFHDTLHHLPVVRQAVVASSYGMRFQGQGVFLTDARTHRGTSGAPVVMRVKHCNNDLGDLPWMLLGIHSSRFDVGTRDMDVDEALGLNCAWYADVLLSLTGG